MLYDIDGSLLADAYGVGGKARSKAYSIDGDDTVFYDLKVMTYNVGQWYLGNHDNVPSSLDGAYYSLQSGMISDHDPDILLLEEYTKEFSKTGRTALSMLQESYPYYHEQGGDNPSRSIGDGRAIYSKYPISNYVVGNFNDGSGLYCDRCTITANDVQYNVFYLHLNWSSGVDDGGKRESEIASVLSTAQNLSNVIIGGDFNNLISSADTDEDRATKYNKYVKPFIDAGYNTANYGDYGYMVTCINGATEVPSDSFMLDNVFTSSNILIHNACVDTTKKTDNIVEKIDHMPLVVQLTKEAVE